MAADEGRPTPDDDGRPTSRDEDTAATAEPSPSPGPGLSRRQLLSYTAVGAGLATAAAVPLADFAGAQEASPLTDRPTVDSATADGGSPALVVQPGATVKTYALGDFVAFGTNPMVLSAHGYYVPVGQIFVGLGLPSGSLIVQIDVYGYTGSAATQTWTLGEFQPERFGVAAITAINPLVSSAGPSTHATVTFSPPLRVNPGSSYMLTNQLALAFDTNQFVGASVQYFPAGAIRTITPTRVYDSRPGTSPAVGPKTPLANGASRTIDCTTAGAVPAGVQAALVNVTVTNTSPSGFLALFQNGVAWPGNSSINWDHAGATMANTQVVALDANGKLASRVNLNCSTDYLIDVVGYIP